MKKLNDYLKDNDIKQRGMAEKLGISASTLHGILTGSIPSLKTAYRIEIYTKGQITLYDWIDEKNFDNIKPKANKSPPRNKNAK